MNTVILVKVSLLYLTKDILRIPLISLTKFVTDFKNEMLKRTSVFWPNGVLKGVGKGGMNPPPPFTLRSPAPAGPALYPLYIRPKVNNPPLAPTGEPSPPAAHRPKAAIPGGRERGDAS